MNTHSYLEIPLFSSDDIRVLFNRIASNAIAEVNRTTIHDGTGAIAHNIYQKFALEELSVDKETRKMEGVGTRTVTRKDDFGEPYEVDVKIYRASYEYKGSDELVLYKPSTYMTGSYLTKKIERSVSNKSLAYSFGITNFDTDKLNRDIEAMFSTLFDNIKYVNDDVRQFNNELRRIIDNRILSKRNEDSDEENFLKKMNSR